MKLAVYGVIFLAMGLFTYFYKLPSVCDTPLKYRIGTIDKGFNMPQSELLSSVNQAESLWENASRKNLYEYDQTDENALTINMIFDKRQEATQALNENQSAVDAKKNDLDPKIAEYERRTAVFKERAATFGATVQKYNEQGGAPEGEYEKLMSEQKSLEQEADALNQMAADLNQHAADYNNSVGQLNNTISEFNDVAKSKPEEGLYDPQANTITIYYHITYDELVHTLAHELGHAAGLDHLPAADAIMYERVNTTLEPTKKDLAALDQVCAPKTTYTKLRSTDWKRFGQFYAQLIGQIATQAQPTK